MKSLTAQNFRSAFEPNRGKGKVTVPKGYYMVSASAFVRVVVNGQMSVPLTALRLVLLDTSQIEVEADGLTEWRLFPVRPFDPVDSVPHEALLVDPKPLTMEEMIRQMIKEEARKLAPEEDESFEESDDFEVEEDEGLPDSPYLLKDGEPDGGLFDDVEPLEKPGEKPTAPAEAAPKTPAPQGAPTGVPPAAGEAKPQAA